MKIKNLLRNMRYPETGCAAPQARSAATGGGAMTTAQILAYCASCIVVVVVGISFLIRSASVSSETIVRSQTPLTAGRFAPIDMGGIYGVVTVRELVNYYLQNPPPAPGQGPALALPKVGGC